MLITFNKMTTLNLATKIDDSDTVIEEVSETFCEGELLDVTETDSGFGADGEYVDLEFSDGAIAFCVPRNSFKVHRDHVFLELKDTVFLETPGKCIHCGMDSESASWNGIPCIEEGAPYKINP